MHVVRQVSQCFAETNPQEVMDLSPVAHLQLLKVKCHSSTSLMVSVHLTRFRRLKSGTMKILKEMCPMDAVEEFRNTCFEPRTSSNAWFYMKTEIFSSSTVKHVTQFTMHLPAVVEKYMNKVNEKLGTNYDLFNYYGAPDADRCNHRYGFNQ